MKALILAGGTGSRLRPFTYNMPKQLVPVANKPVLFHGLETLRKAGVTEAGLVVNADDRAVRAAVGDGSAFGLTITCIPQDEPRGLAHCVLIAQDFLADDDFLMYLGDNIFGDGLAVPAAQFRDTRPAAQLILVKVSDPSAYGVAEVDDSGHVLGLEEKPERPRSNLAVTGAYFFTSQVHEAVRAIRPSWRNELEITHAVQRLVSEGHEVRAHMCAGFWKDTGTVPELLDCNRAMLDDVEPRISGSVDALTQIGASVVIEPGASVTASRIDGPTIIGRGSTVADSYIGPYTAIGSGCSVRDAAVEDTIMLDRSSVQGVRGVKGSVIGQQAGVRGRRQELRAHRLIVGDDSRVEVPA
ncbi:glucose-1-phosphate thymidylyltransferase [Spirillospora sp. NPDC046719]